jgi:TonB family protein
MGSVIVGYRILVCFTGALFATASAGAQTELQADAPNAATVQGDVATPAYAEMPDGLKKLVQDLSDAEKTRDTKKSSEIYTKLVIPNRSQWFGKTFGQTEGDRLDAKYNELIEVSTSSLKKRVALAVQKGQHYVVLRTFLKAEDVQMELLKAILAAMSNPTALYGAAMNSGPEDKSPTLLGDFVYVEGGFRYLDFAVMQALSTAPPPRILGNIQKPKLVKEVNPVYPLGAKAHGVQGTVKLHVIVAKDGSVRQIELVSGDPLLVQAAIDAVKQWRYQRSLLNGQAVEVVTEVNVAFSLKN